MEKSIAFKDEINRAMREARREMMQPLHDKVDEAVMKLLEEINEAGTTVVVVTHNREIVNAMQKRVIAMKKGVIVSDEEEGGYIDED